MSSQPSSPATTTQATTLGGINSQQLRSVIERIENLEEEKANLMADIREVYAEAKANGFDAKILRQVVRIRKMDRDKRSEEEAIRDTYLRALGDA